MVVVVGGVTASIYSIRRVYLLLLLSHSASFILDVSSGVPIFSWENKLLDRPSGRRPDYISCSAQRTLFLFFSNRWAKMKEREGQREEKDEHPSPFAPYRNRWLGLISKNNMRTDEAPPPLAQNPKGGAKYCWGTLTFLIFFPKEWDEANKNKRKPSHFFVLVLFVSGFFYTGNQFLLVMSRERQ